MRGHTHVSDSSRRLTHPKNWVNDDIRAAARTETLILIIVFSQYCGLACRSHPSMFLYVPTILIPYPYLRHFDHDHDDDDDQP